MAATEIIEVTKNGSTVVEVIERGPIGPQGIQGPTGPAGTTDFNALLNKPNIDTTVDGNGGTAGSINASSIFGGTSGSLNIGAGYTGVGGTITTSGGFNGTGGSISTGGIYDGVGGSIDTSASYSAVGGSITTKEGGGSIDTRGTGSFQFGISGTRTTVTGTATADRSIAFPNASGTVALTSDFASPPTIGNSIPNTAFFTEAEVTDSTKGIVMKSPNNTRWRITINDSGTLQRVALSILIALTMAASSIAQTVTDVVVGTNGTLIAPTNFFTANLPSWSTSTNSASAASGLGQPLSAPSYLRTSSRDTSSNNTGGIVSAISSDGINWESTRNYGVFPVFSRDASTIWHSNKWVSIYTDAFNSTNKTFGIATSTDLLSWQTNFSVTLTGTNTAGTANNVWAPEWFVDGTNYYALVRLSTTTGNNYGAPGVGWMRALNPGTWTSWTDWTPFDSTVRVDANDFYIVKKDSLYWLFSHGGTHLNGKQPAGSNVINNITLQYSTNPFGNYSPIVEITEPLRQIIRPDNASAFFEGPSVVNIEGSRWRLYFQDGLDNTAWAIDSYDDFTTWDTNSLRRLQYSGFNGTGHGTAIKIDTTNQVGAKEAILNLGTSQTLGLGPTNSVTFSNVSVNGTITATGNATLNGVNNTAPSQTASSGSSLMTRDLVGQEFANPRTKIQTTYWFGLEGLGLWQTVSGAAIIAGNRGPKFGPSMAIFTATKPATSASGSGVRLGANSITGGGAWRPVDGGAFTAKTHMVNYYNFGAGNRAVGFSFASAVNTNFWAQPDSFGLFWVEQPTNAWAASTAFTLHDRIAVSNVVWVVSTAGTTDTNEPVWTDLIGSVVTNGTAVFRNLGPHTSNNWVLAIGHTNASQVVMTNTGKSNWLRTVGNGGHEVLLTLRYGTNTTPPYTVYGSVADGTGQGAEVTLNLSTNNSSVSPQYWIRYDGTNTSAGNEAAGIRYFSIDAEIPPLN